MQSHEAELQRREAEAAQPPPPPEAPPSFSKVAQKLSRDLLSACARLRKKEAQLESQRGELAGMQAAIAKTVQEIRDLEAKVAVLRSMQPEAAPSPVLPDPETAFFDRGILLLQSEGREAGTWGQIIARV